jgi:monovalent cation/hydrogen antiporter
VAALIILAVVIMIRILWVMIHNRIAAWVHRLRQRAGKPAPPGVKSGVAIGWSGMRGIVTLAAAMALPPGFPQRDFIQLAASVVVLGTLIIQGLTLRPLLALLRLPTDTMMEKELALARKKVLKAALAALDGDDSPGAQRLRMEYDEALTHARQGHAPATTPITVWRKNSTGWS